MNIIQFASDPNLLNLSLSLAQRTLLKTFYGLTLETEELEIFRQCSDQQCAPHEFYELTCIAGARSGKDSRIATSIALFEAFKDHSHYLHPGERGVVLIIAQDQRAGQIAFSYIRAAIEGSDLLASHVREVRKSEIDLDSNITIAVYPCTFRAARGLTIICGIADEVAFWRNEDGAAIPDVEVLRSMRRGMANVPDAKLIKISTPYAKSGILYDDYVRRTEIQDMTLVWKAPTWTMNPSIPQGFLDRERSKDPVAFAREYGAEFSDDLTGFISRSVVESAVVTGRLELPYNGSFRYTAFMDAAGGTGQDSMTLGIAHVYRRSKGADNLFVLDFLKEVRPPFSPDRIVAEFAADLRRYNIPAVFSDRYASGWVKERCRTHGIIHKDSEWSRSELYYELIPLLHSGKLELLNNPRLISQLCGLQRRTTSGGRDHIDHGPGAHDDLANVAAGCLVTAALQREGFCGVF